MHTAPQLFPVPFHGDTVVLVGQDNEPYVAMKPIVANMGLDWASQYTKLKSNSERWGIVIITIPSLGGMQDALCLPLRKVAAWLMGINPNRVAPELREKITRYQEECDDALWNYWTQGVAERPGSAASANKQIALSSHRLALLKELHRTCDRALRVAIHEQLVLISYGLGLTAPPLDDIGSSAPDYSEQILAFWRNIEMLELASVRVNHASPGGKILALNLSEIKSHFERTQTPLKIDQSLREALRQSKSPAYIKEATFHSRIHNKKNQSRHIPEIM
ncbi:phage antirepressor N-terminal domain-containing protein [Pseudomonas sp. JBR1]|uniref:phage antirepressor N-terminal domain-containing protein n=1 Tax=Pseudomonas sp. JBR1 TaxID=3020907 RepID=UPI002304DF35|nr:phage antirepressor N-terminal domain-containing protein [Pseudomonas sp. JBR1]WCE09464.1 phage antirepressor N-terminal domain-containing protein [Pseudomonas sp. JBR1]